MCWPLGRMQITTMQKHLKALIEYLELRKFGHIECGQECEKPQLSHTNNRDVKSYNQFIYILAVFQFKKYMYNMTRTFT